MRIGVTMACEECRQRNYRTEKNRKKNTERIALKKFCKFCRTHTLHRETR